MNRIITNKLHHESKQIVSLLGDEGVGQEVSSYITLSPPLSPNPSPN